MGSIDAALRAELRVEGTLQPIPEHGRHERRRDQRRLGLGDPGGRERVVRRDNTGAHVAAPRQQLGDSSRVVLVVDSGARRGRRPP